MQYTEGVGQIREAAKPRKGLGFLAILSRRPSGRPLLSRAQWQPCFGVSLLSRTASGPSPKAITLTGF